MGKSAVVAVLAAIVVLVWAATALGKAGDVYVASNDGVEGVYKVGPGGGAATALSTSPSFNEPWGMAMLPNGDLLVADLAADAIFQVNSRTGVTSTYLSGPALGSPVDIALGPDGFLYVTELQVAPTDAATVLRINPRTKAVQTLASSPFEDPFGIAVTRAGTIFVAEEGDERGVYRLLPGGSPIEIGTPRSSRRRASL